MRVPDSSRFHKARLKNDRATLEARRQRDLARLHDAWAVLTAGPAAGDAALLVAVLAATAVRS